MTCCAGLQKVREIQNEPKVSVFLYRPGDHSSIGPQGETMVVTDVVLRKEMWKEKWAVSWPVGPTNEDFTLIKIVPRKTLHLDWPNRRQEVLDLQTGFARSVLAAPQE